MRVIILEGSSGTCFYCKQTDTDLRPYGPNNELVCFECAMLPENIKVTDKKFKEILTGSGAVDDEQKN